MSDVKTAANTTQIGALINKNSKLTKILRAQESRPNMLTLQEFAPYAIMWRNKPEGMTEAESMRFEKYIDEVVYPDFRRIADPFKDIIVYDPATKEIIYTLPRLHCALGALVSNNPTTTNAILKNRREGTSDVPRWQAEASRGVVDLYESQQISDRAQLREFAIAKKRTGMMITAFKNGKPLVNGISQNTPYKDTSRSAADVMSGDVEEL